MNSFSNNFTGVYLPISKSEKQFQVNHVYCVGRNYTEHAIEMGEDDRQPPFFFSKPNCIRGSYVPTFIWIKTFHYIKF